MTEHNKITARPFTRNASSSGQNLSRQNLSRQNLSSQNLSGQNLSGHNFPTPCNHERNADKLVHLAGMAFVVIACLTLMVKTSFESSIWLVLACAVYCLAMMASFFISAGYHLLPRHDLRDTLGRLDHMAIYALIAGTFTPLLVKVGTTWSLIVLALIWGLALPAMAYKLYGAHMPRGWSLASYLGLGWLGIIAAPEFTAQLPIAATTAILIGGVVYSSGTFFYARPQQSYRYAIWHCFVLAGTGMLFFAVWTAVSPQIAVATP